VTTLGSDDGTSFEVPVSRVELVAVMESGVLVSGTGMNCDVLVPSLEDRVR
jgi:hypothetical protein